MVRVGSSSTHRRRSPPSEVDASEEGIVIGETAMLYYGRYTTNVDEVDGVL